MPAPDDELPRVLVAWVSAMLAAGRDQGHPFQADGWRSGTDPVPYVVALDRPVRVDRARGRVDDHEVRQVSAEDHVLVLSVDGRREVAVVNVQPDVFGDHGALAGDGTLLAPMPGTVLAVDVAEGERVEEGQRLGVLEAMKMELALTAPFTGTVEVVGAAVGGQVQLGQLLFEVSADA